MRARVWAARRRAFALCERCERTDGAPWPPTDAAYQRRPSAPTGLESYRREAPNGVNSVPAG